MKKDHSTQRILNDQPLTLNEGYNFGYSGVTQFSSVRNRGALSYLNKMGYRSEGTNLTIEGVNNTLLMDSFVGIDSILSNTPPLLFGYEKVSEAGAYQLYQTDYSLPLGMLTDEGIYDTAKVSNQTDLWHYLSGTNTDYVGVTGIDSEKITNGTKTEQGQSVVYSQTQPGEAINLEWVVTVPKHRQAYLSLYSADNAMMKNAKATVTVQGQSNTYEMAKVGQYYPLGYYEEETTVSVAISISGTSVVQIPAPTVLLLDTEQFAASAKKIQEKGVPLEVRKNRASGTIDADTDEVLLTTIAYDTGWTVRIDGKKYPTKAFEKGLLSVSIPKGRHEIDLVYYPPGLFLGLGLSVSSLCVFLLERLWTKKKRRRRP